MNTIGEKIKEARISRGWTRRILARKCGFTEASIYGWEKDAYKPSERGIRALERAFSEQLRK